ncbi:MAG TPA: hypothetical protein VN851_02045 [Thermoanaerobaculia bacterium]|nr:hypothetical protein [Thermoanaerobaculia bacterium]
MKLPLLFGRSELVEGDGFLARVHVSGRALLTEEEGRFWVEGVTPGGFAASGATSAEALTHFCEEYNAVLFDIAADAPSFEDFEAEVQRFFNDTSEEVLGEWKQAVEEVRSGTVNQANWLKKQSADSPVSMVVKPIGNPSASHNLVGETALAA